jgi:hypothetical protein
MALWLQWSGFKFMVWEGGGACASHVAGTALAGAIPILVTPVLTNTPSQKTFLAINMKSRTYRWHSKIKNHNQSLVTQINKLKNAKKSQKERLEQFYSKEAMTSEETLLEPIEIKNLPVKKIQTSEKGINTDLVELPIVSIVEERSNQQDSKEIQVPYCHPNHKSHYDQQQSRGIWTMFFLPTTKLQHCKGTKTKSTTCMEARNEKPCQNNQ